MSRGSYARSTEVKRDEHRTNARGQRWVDRTSRVMPDEYHNKVTTVMRLSLKHHLANECIRYYEVRGCSAQIVNEINKGTMDAPGGVLMMHAKTIVAQAMRRGMITQGEG